RAGRRLTFAPGRGNHHQPFGGGQRRQLEIRHIDECRLQPVLTRGFGKVARELLGIAGLTRVDDRQRLGRTCRGRRMRRHNGGARSVKTCQKPGEPRTLDRACCADDAIEEVDLLFSEWRGLRNWRHTHYLISRRHNQCRRISRRQMDAGNRWLTMARRISRTTPIPRLQPISFFSTGNKGSACALRSSSPIFTCDTFCSFAQLAKGGLTPLKNSQEISRPTQITKPNRLTKYTAASRPMPSCQSFLKLESTPIEKKVRMKNTTRKVLASPIAAGTFAAMSAGVASAR